MDGRLRRRAILATGAVGAGALLLGGRNGGDAGRSAARDIRREGVRMESHANKGLWVPWLELWNGNLAVADEIVAPSFIAHFAPAGSSPAEVRGPEGLKGWIGGALAAFSDHRFATTVGPLADGDLVAGRWVFRGTYRGGIPGSSPAAVGQPVEYAGIDIFRVEDGKLVEYWLSADILQMLQQVGVIPS